MRRAKEGWDPPFFCQCVPLGITTVSNPQFRNQLRQNLLAFWEHPMLRMKNPILQRIWAIITWRWRMQIALNAPFALLWVADKTNPAVHAFNMTALSAMHAEWLAPMIGIA